MTLQHGEVQGEILGLADKNLFSLVRGAPVVLSLNVGALFINHPHFRLQDQSREVHPRSPAS
jgi:hypothetical protein